MKNQPEGRNKFKPGGRDTRLEQGSKCCKQDLGSLVSPLNEVCDPKPPSSLFQEKKKNHPLFLLEGKNTCWSHRQQGALPSTQQRDEAGMLLSIEMGKLRHSGWRGPSMGTGSSPCHRLPPCLAWSQVEIFIKPIREQKEFSKRRSYVTSPRPPRTSSVIIGLGWGGALRGAAGGGHHSHGHPKGLHPPLPHHSGSQAPGTTLCHCVTLWNLIPEGP